MRRPARAPPLPGGSERCSAGRAGWFGRALPVAVLCKVNRAGRGAPILAAPGPSPSCRAWRSSPGAAAVPAPGPARGAERGSSRLVGGR